MRSKLNFKKILRGIAITIIVYITVSILATKFIYDSIFDRYAIENTQAIVGETEGINKKEKYYFNSGENSLEGILYSDKTLENGLIIFVPGLKAEVIEYEPVILSFVKEGFDVFAFNPTGHGSSEGESAVGFSQIISDMESAVKFVNDEFCYNDVFLLGHSRGGFAIFSVLNTCDNITAAVSVNATDTAMDAIMAYSTDYVGNIAYGNYIFLNAYERFLFGSEIAEFSASEQISKSDVPIMVIQSEKDDKVPVNKYSIYSKRDEITTESAEFVLYDKDGKNGHTNILYGKDRKPNEDIVNMISTFYKEKTESKDINK